MTAELFPGFLLGLFIGGFIGIIGIIYVGKESLKSMRQMRAHLKKLGLE